MRDRKQDDEHFVKFTESGRGVQNKTLVHKCVVRLAVLVFSGYKSWRHPELGSWFVRDLVTVIQHGAHREHLEDMLTQVQTKPWFYSKQSHAHSGTNKTMVLLTTKPCSLRYKQNHGFTHDKAMLTQVQTEPWFYLRQNHVHSGQKNHAHWGNHEIWFSPVAKMNHILRGLKTSALNKCFVTGWHLHSPTA